MNLPNYLNFHCLLDVGNSNIRSVRSLKNWMAMPKINNQ